MNRTLTVTITLAIATLFFASFTAILLAQPKQTIQYVIPPQAEYTCSYKGYTIYHLTEINKWHPHNPPTFIAVKGDTILKAVDYPDLLADIDEALR